MSSTWPCRAAASADRRAPTKKKEKKKKKKHDGKVTHTGRHADGQERFKGRSQQTARRQLFERGSLLSQNTTPTKSPPASPAGVCSDCGPLKGQFATYLTRTLLHVDRGPAANFLMRASTRKLPCLFLPPIYNIALRIFHTIHTQQSILLCNMFTVIVFILSIFIFLSIVFYFCVNCNFLGGMNRLRSSLPSITTWLTAHMTVKLKFKSCHLKTLKSIPRKQKQTKQTKTCTALTSPHCTATCR